MGAAVASVELVELRKCFGREQVIDGLTLDIEPGSLVALLGPSGCGKTTVLRMIAGLEAPGGGDIRFNGQSVIETEVRRRNVGMVFQQYALFPHMTAAENVAFGLNVRGLSKAAVRAEVDAILDVVQLSGLHDRFPSQLSGGQMQRVALARTLVTRPSVLMFDEPLANLDAQLRVELRSFIRKLQQDLAITTIFVTHDHVEAMELADRVAVLFDGRLAQYAPPHELYLSPISSAVANFMGAGNIFPARIRADYAVDTPLGVLPSAYSDRFVVGQEVRVMLRAEAIGIAQPGMNSETATLNGKIEERVFLGGSVTYAVSCNGQTLRVTETPYRLLDVGSEVSLAIPAEHAWIMEK